MTQSAYKTRIEKQLAKLSVGVSPGTLFKYKKAVKNGTQDVFANSEWVPGNGETGADGKLIIGTYSLGEKCQLCGHNPIKRVFFIQSKTSGKILRIGSECATNYIDADIVNGLAKQFQIDYNKIVNPIKYEDGVDALEWALDTGVRPPSRLAWKLINSGNPRSILFKVRAGKAITKREKEVFEVYKNLYENKEIHEVLVQWEKDAATRRRERFQREYEERQRDLRFKEFLRYALIGAGKDAAQAIGNFLVATNNNSEYTKLSQLADTLESLSNLSAAEKGTLRKVRNIIKFNGPVEDWRIDHLAQVVERVKNRSVNDDTSELDALVQNAAGAVRNAWERKFVNNVGRYYEVNRFLSDKQKAALEKIVARAA